MDFAPKIDLRITVEESSAKHPQTYHIFEVKGYYCIPKWNRDTRQNDSRQISVKASVFCKSGDEADYLARQILAGAQVTVRGYPTIRTYKKRDSEEWITERSINMDSAEFVMESLEAAAPETSDEIDDLFG
jgi:hypothetical protein